MKISNLIMILVLCAAAIGGEIPATQPASQPADTQPSDLDLKLSYAFGIVLFHESPNNKFNLDIDALRRGYIEAKNQAATMTFKEAERFIKKILLPQSVPSPVSPQGKCLGNLKKIGDAIQAYRNGHAGSMPEDFNVLIKTGVIVETNLHCPSSKNIFQRSYILRGNDLGAKADGSMIAVYEDPQIHGGDDINVLFMDGSQKTLDEKEFAEAVQADNLKCATLGLPEK